MRCEITDFAGDAEVDDVFSARDVAVDLLSGGRTMESEKILGLNGPTSGEQVKRSSALLMNSGPLSARIVRGVP
ncbi:MAG: hypothetical protein J4F47_11240 [Alphaproteobacteria bacterium]|nr:hypothetical protein [Alphaproteobacteria bacterium]